MESPRLTRRRKAVMKAQLIKRCLFGLGISLVLSAVPASAHHPLALEFDWMKPFTLTGTVTKVEWTNPHAFVLIDVQDASGIITNWALELGSPRVLEKHYGWNGNLLKTGDKVSVDGWLAKNGQKQGSAKSFTLTDGREFFAASSFFDLPGRCISDEVCIEDESTAKPGAQR
jgi:Family of unknown function (DUF6152)